MHRTIRGVQAIVLDPTPLARDDLGAIHVSGTRITLESVVLAFDAGATPEDIVQKFPALSLAAVYAVCAHRLAHRAEVDVYMAARARAAEEARAEVEARFPPSSFRDVLLERRRLSR